MTNQIADPLEHLEKSLCYTARSRFNASKRLERRDRRIANHYVRCGVVALQREGAAVLGPVKDAVRRYAVACGHP